MSCSSAVPRRVALIGHPVAHSRSPALQEAAFAALGIPARYEPWDTLPEDLAERVAALRGPEMLGANVTIPYKVAVGQLVDEVAPEVERAGGAVNTVTRAEGPDGIRLIGHNTDLSALVRIIEENRDRPGEPHERALPREMLVLGAGGSARAALGAAQTLDYTPWVAARSVDSARAALARGPEQWGAHAFDLHDRAALAAVLRRVGVVVQATSVGMNAPEESALPLDLLDALPAGALVIDLVYAPPVTALVRAAHSAGLRAVGGMDILLYQGMEAFRLWTDQPAPEAEMRSALEASG